MSELCDALSVVFTDSPKIEDHLFAKAIRWADQNPNDIVFWARRKALNRIPEIDVDWSSKVAALRRIRFGYNRRNLLLGCIDEAVKGSIDCDVAAIICSLSVPKNGSQMGSLLAALAHFCNSNDGRAVAVIDLRRENGEEEDDEEDDQTDPFENFEFLDEVEEEKPKELTGKTSEEIESQTEKLKRISGIYTKNVFTFDGDKFTSCYQC
ncbi:unnamed protein product [Caenorhabditis sp. 36 PRJEB53466]|nr:unnamed protein product [Caenorhabditis sp. 36 PRJEB53466]